MLEREKLLQAAKEFGTPLYVYDIEQIRQCYKKLFEFIKYPQLKIHYAMKANYNIGILKALKEIGCGVDTVSPAEVLMALQIGFDKNRIIYTANNMTDAEFERVHRTGVVMNIVYHHKH